MFSGVVHKFEFKIWVLIFSGEERIWRFRKSELCPSFLICKFSDPIGRPDFGNVAAQ